MVLIQLHVCKLDTCHFCYEIIPTFTKSINQLIISPYRHTPQLSLYPLPIWPCIAWPIPVQVIVYIRVPRRLAMVR